MAVQNGELTEQDIREIVRDELGGDDSDSDQPASTRRQVLEALGIAGAGAAVGGLGTSQAMGRAQGAAGTQSVELDQIKLDSASTLDLPPIETEQIFEGSRGADVVIYNDSGTYRALGRSSEVSNGTDLGTVLNDVVAHVPRNGDVKISRGDYTFSTQVVIDKPLSIEGSGSQEGRWNSSEGGTRLTWNGGATPSILVGGDGDGTGIEGVRLREFYLEPGTDGGGDVGILWDGSQTIDSNRGSIADVSAAHVHVRDFGTYQMHVLGNVFDYTFERCAFHGAGTLVKHESATSAGAQNTPNYGEYYSCAWHSGSTGSTALDGSFRGNIIGGFASTDNGFSMGYVSSIRGTHMESAASGSNTWGIKVGNGPCVVSPRMVSGCTTGLLVDHAGNQATRVLGGIFSGSSESIRLESGKLTVLAGRAPDGVVDNESLGGYRDLNNIGYVAGENSTLFEPPQLPISFGNGSRTHQMGYDDGGTNEPFYIESIDDGGVLTRRLELESRVSQATATWNRVDHDLGGGLLDNADATVYQQRGDPSTSELDSGETMVYNSDGSGTGAAGDLVYAINDGGTIETQVIVAESNAS